MQISKLTSQAYDAGTELLLELFESPYLNLGLWDSPHLSFPQAQLKLVQRFAEFSRLGPALEILDVGCGTGEQDFYFFEKGLCRSVLGLNISQVQIGMAQKKLASLPHLAGKIKFGLEDALKIHQYPEQSFDRVLALESANFFEDKAAFFEGARWILRQNGYLSIAGQIPIQEGQYEDEELLESFLQETGEVFETHVQDLKSLREWLRVARVQERDLKESCKNFYISKDGYFELLREKGFFIDETEELSSKVLGMFSCLKKRVQEVSLKYPPGHPFQDLLKRILLILFVTRYHAFRSGGAGYWMILAKKIDK